uniref:C2H2-type domain-containing protein n=1 Tax=Esox lucius TaxID=8010 RepID=A0A3P8YYR6_ESOLU
PMSSPGAEDDDEVEFVSEAPLRPVLECIDLLSEGEDDESSPMRAQVTSTLDRLARQVASAKKERAEKCRAFKVRAPRQELAINATGHTNDAKRCVDMWLKMPGKTVWWPEVSSSGSIFPHIPCPVINCGRVYDNVPLLEGHLKRFDHSPCDPTIHLRGSPAELQACVACGLHFETKEAWKVHQRSKLSSSDRGHNSSRTCQSIVCFACPSCYLLFYIRDECLQHMSAKNHCSQAIVMSAMPVPIPRYAKNRLIAMCKEVSFSVRCTHCRKAIHSHMEAQAHFNVQCRQGGARAEAEKTVVQVMKQLQALGQCYECGQLFTKPGQADRHKELNQHDVEVNGTMERAILHYCNFYEIQHAKRASAAGTSGPRQFKGPGAASQKDKNWADSVRSPAKRPRLCGGANGSAGPTGSGLKVAWFCECGQRFSEEALATKHLLAANQIFHQCGVCGKHMGESSITRLHMSRFHGGAHLSNFLFHCRLCKVDMPRHEDILSHVAESHRGHTYFSEREVPVEEPAPIPDAQPSTSGGPRAPTESRKRSAPFPPPPPEQDERWMCRMCEDVFPTERAAHKHCRDVRNHSFQRFVCGHCPQKFFKEATLRRHCVNEHQGQVVTRYFCGLCDSMEYDTEEEFQQHYSGLHSKDYYRMDEPEERPLGRPAEAPSPSQLTLTKESSECPCMSSDKDKVERKATFTRCVKRLSREGRCRFVCPPCGVRVSSFAQVMTHVHTRHDALGLGKSFDVVCGACQESHKDVPSFHNHYHSRHCPLDPCCSSRGGGGTDFICLNCHIATEILEMFLLGLFLNTVYFVHVCCVSDESEEDIKRALALSVKEAREPDEIDIGVYLPLFT